MADLVDAQEGAIVLLAEPATHGVSAVHRIDMHAASVFLAGERAFKIKRAVRFPFLDYSTLEKRKAACETELAVNRPFAADIYRRVVPITQEADGRLAIGGTGRPVEWAVEMRRFDENATLDRLAERQQIDVALADALGRAVAEAHAAAPIVEAEPWIAALADFIEQNDVELREQPQIFPASEVDALTRASRKAFAHVRPLIAARGRLGLVRHGHGDLHLGNIVLLEGRPVLFDAIEFDPLIASGDVLYDLAFLLMDLVERGLDAAANVVFNRYLALTRRAEDLDALAALPLFTSVRAAIRAKVTAARLTHAKSEARPDIIHAAQTYFRLAQRLIKPCAPVLVGVGGLSGTGKSLLARSLAPILGAAPGALVLRSDVERKALFGRAETERLPSSAYDPVVNAQVYASLADKSRRALAAGHAVIVDAVFAKPQERAEMAALAKRCGVGLRGLFLTAPLATRLARLGKRVGDASDADAAVARGQESQALGELDWRLVDASGTADETFATARTALFGSTTGEISAAAP
jgi:uncharacterized protein